MRGSDLDKSVIKRIGMLVSVFLKSPFSQSSFN